MNGVYRESLRNSKQLNLNNKKDEFTNKIKSINFVQFN